MKFVSGTILLIFMSVVSYAQVITYEDFKSVIPYIQKEDYKSAFDKTKQLLQSTDNDSSDLRGIVTYMNIFSAAGMVSLRQMTHDEFLQNANKYIGQWLVMPFHPCVDSADGGFNSLFFITKDGVLQGEVTASNNANTSILCFEYFKYADPVEPDNWIGKNVRCGGIFKTCETNPNKSTIWIARLFIEDALVWEVK